MSEPSELRYAALLKRPERFDFRQVARVLAERRRVPVEDTMNEAKACWGILAEGSDRREAEGLCAALAAAGIEALAIPRDLIEDLPPARQVSKHARDAGATRFFDDAAAPETVRDPDAAMLCAAILKQRVTRTIKVQEDVGVVEKAVKIGFMLAAGIPPMPGRMKREVDKTLESSDLFGYLDIILKAPARRLRIDAQAFDYSGLGPRKGYDALGNFRLLVAELSGLWPGALRGRGTRSILEGTPVRDMGHGSLADLERESRWLLTLETLKP